MNTVSYDQGISVLPSALGDYSFWLTESTNCKVAQAMNVKYL